MTRTMEAIYENGAFRPVSPVRLPNGTRVTMTVALDEITGSASNAHGRFSWQRTDLTLEDSAFSASEEVLRQRAAE
jgi:predicted DNA-binding antitoxin AbrB/MazE fold protein